MLGSERKCSSHLALQLRNRLGELGLRGFWQLRVEALAEAPHPVLPVPVLQPNTGNIHSHSFITKHITAETRCITESGLLGAVGTLRDVNQNQNQKLMFGDSG